MVRYNIRGAAALVAVGAALLARPLAAQEIRFGKVSITKLNASFTQLVRFYEEQRERETRIQNQIRQRAEQFPLLLDEEWNQFCELRDRRDQLTPAERETMNTLIGLSEKRDRELSTLETRGNLSDEDKAKLQELQSTKRQAKDGTEAMARRLVEELNQWKAKTLGELDSQLAAAVKKVADAQGLQLVLRVEDVLYGGVDITDAVLAELNAGAPPAGGTTPAPPAGGDG